jgi:hypothetical protein
MRQRVVGSAKRLQTYVAERSHSTPFYLILIIAGIISIVTGVFVQLVGYDTAPPDKQKTRSIVFTFFYTLGGCILLVAFLLAIGIF